jgi:hypothetical protein
VQRVCGNEAFEVAASDDQEPVEALAPQSPDPALGVCSCPRRPQRRLDHTDVGCPEDLVEVAREFAVAVTDQKPRVDAIVFELHQQVARLLRDPPAVRVGGDPR